MIFYLPIKRASVHVHCKIMLLGILGKICVHVCPTPAQHTA